MEKSIKTEIKINATPEKIWKIFSDFKNYSSWNPFIKSLTGDVAVGNKIKVVLNGMKFKPRVLEYAQNKKFVWKGNLFIPGIFDGQHQFEFISNNDGTTTLIHSEKFSGILSGPILKKVKEDTIKGFNDMNKALKELSEKS